MSKLNTVKIERTLIVTDEDIDDIMASALNAGIAHWCRSAVVVGEFLGNEASDQISRGGVLKLYTADGEAHNLSKYDFLQGVKKAAEEGYEFTSAPNGGNGTLTIDDSQIDGELGDVIIQYALFGDIDYD